MARDRMFAWLSIFYTFTSICTKLNTSLVKSNQRCTHLYRIWYSWMIWWTTDQHFIGRILIISFAHFQTFGHFPSIPILQCVRESLRVPSQLGGKETHSILTSLGVWSSLSLMGQAKLILPVDLLARPLETHLSHIYIPPCVLSAC